MLWGLNAFIKSAYAILSDHHFSCRLWCLASCVAILVMTWPSASQAASNTQDDCSGNANIFDTQATLRAIEVHARTKGMSVDTQRQLLRLVEQSRTGIVRIDTPTDTDVVHFDMNLRIKNQTEYADYLPRFIRYGLRYKQKLAYLIIDLSHGAEIHRTYGEDISYEALQTVAQTLSLNTKVKKDYLFRGERHPFVMVMMDTDGPGLEIVTQRIFHELSQFAIERYTEANFRTGGEDSFEEATLLGRVGPEDLPTHQLSVSIGAVIVDGTDPRQIFRFASYLEGWQAGDVDPIALEARRLLGQAKNSNDTDSPHRLVWNHFAVDSPPFHLSVE